MLRPEARFVLYDTLREPTYNEFQRVESFPELCRLLAKDPPIFRVAFSWNGVAEREIDFARVCEAVYCSRSLVFAVDEIDTFCAPTYTPRHLDMIVSLGRHRGISFWGATRRPKEIPALIRAQANEVISYTQTEPADLDWCRQVMGERADELPGLGKYKAFEWRDGT